MKILLVDNGTRLIKHLESFVPDATVVHAPEGIKEVRSGDYDLAIFSGGSNRGALDASWEPELAFIRSAQIPVLGICLGFELIALAYGGSLKRLDVEHQGFSLIKVVNSDPLFAGRTDFPAYEHHKVGVDTLPADFITLAVSGTEISAFRHKTLPIYGFQFHPEYDVDRKDSGKILESFINTFGRAVPATASA